MQDQTRRGFLKHAAAFSAVAGIAGHSSATAQDCNGGGCINPDGCGGDGGCTGPEGCGGDGSGDCFYGYGPGCIDPGNGE